MRAVPSTKKPNLLFLLGLYVTSCLLFFCFFYFVLEQGKQSFCLYDSDQYLAIARSLLKGQGFWEAEHNWYAYRLPGYSLLLAAMMRVVGDTIFGVLFLQIILLSFLPLAFYFLSKTLFPLQEQIARTVSVIGMVWFSCMLYAGFLLTEGIFTLLFLWMIVFYLQGRSKLSRLLVAGAMVGFLSLIRPVGAGLMILLSLGIILEGYNSTFTWGSIFKRIALFIMSWGAVVLPWLIRNYMIFGAFFFHSLPGKHFLQYSAANVYAAAHNLSYLTARQLLFEQADKEISLQSDAKGRALNEYEECRILEKKAWEILIKNPFYTLKDCCINWGKTLCMLHSTPLVFAHKGWPAYTSHTPLVEKIMFYIGGEKGPWWLTALVWYDIMQMFFLWVCVLAAIIARASNLLSKEIFWGCFFLCGFFVFLTLSYSCARLRAPIEPLILIVGIYSLYQLYRQACFYKIRSRE